MGVPASAAGTGGGGAMTSYGSVLPPSSPGAIGAAGGASAPSLPPPSVSSAGAVAGGTTAAGFVPALHDSAPGRVSRDLSMSDLESARAAVADLAAASSVVYPVLQWAVAVARGASGVPEMWVTTNEGSAYIPRGVFIPRAMAVATGFDPGFDGRWFGWTNPAETVLRAIQARGDALSAIATTWPQESELLRETTPDVAIGVAPSGSPLEAEAANLTRGRSHRLETVDPVLFGDLERNEDAVVDAYVQHVTQQVAFDAGPELSGTAQSVARNVISRRWPSAEDWAALRAEYDSLVLMASSQRPGLIGVEEPAQMVTYQGEFVQCRRLEALLCWEYGAPADVVYAARMAGVVMPFAVTND
jgi:hypothetical protein